LSCRENKLNTFLKNRLLQELTHLMITLPSTFYPNMFIKIYFEDKPLYLTDAPDEEIESYRHHDDAVYMDELSAPAINSMIHEMRRPNIHAGIYFYSDLEKLKHALFKKFTIISAAGGLTLNDEGRILMIFRRGKWDLPKGKVEEGEPIEACALRETQEETGLKKLIVKKHLITTYHTYIESGKPVLKDTHWYLMSAPGKQALEPQTEEQITNIEWADTQDLSKYLANTYLLIGDVLAAAGVLNVKLKK